MLTKVEVYGAPEDPLELFVDDNIEVIEVQIRDIVGLGPVSANINTAPYASSKGEGLRGKSVGKRNIVLTLGFAPTWSEGTITSLRQSLYPYFMPEEPVTLHLFSDDMPTVKIDGYIESHEPVIFSKDPEVQISIICPQPDFVAIDETVIEGVVGTSFVATDIEYEGSVASGIYLEVETSVANPAYTGTITVKNQVGSSIEIMAVDTTVDADEKLEWQTISGSKFVRKDTSGVKSNLLGETSADLDWIQLKPNYVNEFGVYSGEAGQAWTLTYYARYGGL